LAEPFFIVGNDRSGTTMLRLILDRGPDAAIPPESMYLTDLVDPPGNAEAARELMAEVWSHPKVALWDLPGEPPAVPDGLSPQDAYRLIMAAPFEAYARKHGKLRWGDKTPHYVHHVDHLMRLWPEARVVVLVRDGRDVALSLKRMPFGPNNAWAAAQWWARGIRAGQAAQVRYPENVMTVRYEDLATRPEQELPRICEFLGLRQTPEMLQLETADRSKIVADQASWFPTLFDGINTKAVNRWVREMSVRDQNVFASLAGQELSALGYDVAPAAGLEVSPLQERWFRYHNELMRNVNFLRLRLVQERGRELRFALERRVRDPQRGRR
jgi:hypothetical protein